MQNSHYNTTHESGRLLAEFEGKAVTQEDRILDYFTKRPRVIKSPSQIQFELAMHKVPITSIRRAITNLTTDGKLVKTNYTRNGPYGRPECCWRLAIRTNKQAEMFSHGWNK